ncbi:MAG TPA: hypothetical protein DHV16_04580 [Nitrospiraceae bacterium]|nr:MAG: hypothetical protein A2Z82_00085 [Nitrospirae bacterium GWA2_46_11]OGW23473.1 MAG: hypothetical protein A2X55_11235 [Nitrospirae bacterium GWB2_47_37]HCZ11525.1 hypothetical protein [Nitrospiraceae bacterium]
MSFLKTIYSGAFNYRPAGITQTISEGLCIIDIVRYDNGIHCVMMTEDTKNKGISITGASDRIATQIYAAFLKNTPQDRIIWLEHTPASRTHKARIDLVQFQYHAKSASFTNPQWKSFLESRRITPPEFLKNYGYILKELCNAQMIFAVEDRKNHYWRVWAAAEGFFIISSNRAAKITGEMLDAPGVVETLKNNRKFFDSDMDIEERFTTALMKGFLNKGL